MILEAGFVLAAVLATGVGAGRAAALDDPWPFTLAAVALGVLAHAQPRALEPGAGPTDRSLVFSLSALACVLLIALTGGGHLFPGDGLVLAWALAWAHWTSGSPTLAGSLVPLTLLPLVVARVLALSPASAGAAALVVLGWGTHRWLRAGGVSDPRSSRTGTRLALAAVVAVPLVPFAVRVVDLGAVRGGALLFDGTHGSTQSIDIGIDRDDGHGEPLPGHERFAALARREGWTVRTTDGPLTGAAFSGVSVLMVAMNTRPFAPAERAAIERFVRDGGGLLVVGDHTDVDGTSSAMNPLLESFGTRLRFDTVWRRPDSGTPDVAVMPHALTRGLGRLYFSTGCSLELSGSDLAPLVRGGPMLFADAGDLLADARLGNARRDAGEPQGDLVLAAAGSCGLGRVVVLGDSAYLQNPVIAANRAFATRLLRWLDRRERFALARCLARLLALAVAAGVLLATVARPPGVRRVRLALLAAIALAQALWTRAELPGRDPAPGPDRTVVVDLAHGNRMSLFWQRGVDAQRRDASNILLRELEARGLEPVLHERWSGPIDDRVLAGAALLVVAHPDHPYSAREQDAIRRFAGRGGGVLLLVGPGRGGGRVDLLPALGLTASPMPVGVAAPDLFAGEFAVQLPYGEGAYPPAAVARPGAVTGLASIVPVDPVEVGGGEPLASAFGKPVAATRGRVVLLGDAEHFTDFAFLDDQKRIDADRIGFLRDIVTYTTRGAP